MKNKFLQILTLCGLYFLASSFFTLILPQFRTIFAVLFLIFLPLMLIVICLKPSAGLQNFIQRSPKTSSLLAILGGYLLAVFFLHTPLALSDKLANIPNIEFTITIIDILLLIGLVILFIITLFKKTKDN